MIRMPWSDTFSPHIVLEINSKCNISCQGCYKKLDGSTKPISQLVEELDVALSKRKVQTVSIAGGEPTLHPLLCEIISNIHNRNLKTALITNGLELNELILKKLKSAGLDIIMLHIDRGQIRPELPEEPKIKDVTALISELSSKIAEKGINVGLMFTIHYDKPEDTAHIIEYIIQSDHINLLLATNYIDTNSFGNPLGLQDRCSNNDSPEHSCKRNTWIAKKLDAEFGILPYAYLPADNQDQWGDGNWPWILYFLPVVYTGAEPYYYRVKSNYADKLLLKIVHFIGKRPIFYSGQNQIITFLRVLLNVVTGFNFTEGFRFISKSLNPQAYIRSKGLIFENGPVLTDEGVFSCSKLCTNATVRNGQLVPICVADHVFKEV